MSKFPDVLQKRSLLYGAKSDDKRQLVDNAKKYLESERYAEAIAFYAKAEANEELEALCQKVADLGNAHLLLRIFSHLEKSNEAQLKKCYEVALDKEHFMYAALVCDEWGKEEEATQLRAKSFPELLEQVEDEIEDSVED